MIHSAVQERIALSAWGRNCHSIMGRVFRAEDRFGSAM